MFGCVRELQEKIDQIIGLAGGGADVRRKGHDMVQNHRYTHRVDALAELVTSE